MNTLYRLLTVLLTSTLIVACDAGDIAANADDISSSGVGTTIIGVGIPAGTASVDLRWDIPSTKVDGSPISLSELGGYRVYASTSSNGYYSMVADINDGTESQHTLGGLSPGTYYLYIITYDVNGDESPYSNIVETTVA